MATLIDIGHSYHPLFQAQNWKDGLFQKFGQGLDILVHQVPPILHISKAAIMVYTFVLLLHGLFLSCRRDPGGLPQSAVDGKKKKNVRRVKLALPLGPFAAWHLTLKTNKGDRVIKTGVSLGPIKIMIVMALENDWESIWDSIRPQAKVYGSVLCIKGSTTVR
ncbi:hypothetical protein JDV02_001417 [Purpureocillium takamizusanense]|uniref:Uncharacterized protein n=1 Tax=Purpureocillium takamizusanense TaxID=2060973 RepID=A0A9Q8V7T8_9HYPO|nr:uncharacterized protein JDV02_001417 [Purpureocillium takamizusanense]UNI14826.1 hypothetical protein JDV02_001417 [Purpureocillium takamizusanense]